MTLSSPEIPRRRVLTTPLGGAGLLAVAGKTAFDEASHRIDASLIVVQWQKGVPVTVYPPEAVVAPPTWPKT